MSDNYKNVCRFSEQTISYLYGEIDSRNNNSRFESHIETCAVCSDEIKNFNAVRETIGLWKKKEFDLLKTPQIEFMPGGDGNAVRRPNGSLKNLFANFNKLFVPSPVFAVGLMFILISAGLILFTGKFSSIDENAVIENGNSQIADNFPAVSKNSDRVVDKNLTGSIDNTYARQAGSAVSDAAEPAGEKSNPTNKKPLTSDTNLQETIAVSKPENKREREKTKFKDARLNNLKTVAVNQSAIGKTNRLKLNSEDEDEETSLRLTDLLDALGEK